MNHSIRINVVGGSASTAFALPDENWSWPAYLQQLRPDTVVKTFSKSGLSITTSLPILSQLEKCEILFLHLGTSVGWPVPIIRFSSKLDKKYLPDTFFHHPPKPYQGGLKRRFIKNLKRKTKSTFKYVLFFAGLYKPRTSIHEVELQVESLIKIASQKARYIIWIQHQPLQNTRISLERKIFNRYYKRVVTAIKFHAISNLTLVELGSDFLISENYLMDGVHLSEQGHYVLAHRLADMIKDLSSSNVETD